MRRYFLIALVLSLSANLTFAQVQQRKEDPTARLMFEFNRIKDPKTNKIPDNIRILEREFMEKQEAKLRSSSRMESVSSVSWENRGPYNVGGRTRALAIDHSDATENTILAGGISGGVWRTTNGGSTWSKMTTPTDLQSISCIVQDTTSLGKATWYYGTGEFSGNSAGGFGAPYRGDGIFKSTDGGLTWAILAATSTEIPQTFDSDFDYNHEIAINPQNGDVFVANYGGIYRSQNAGNSFDQVLAGAGWSEVTVTSEGILYAFIEGDGIYQSTSGGASGTWSEITDINIPTVAGDRYEFAVAPSNEDILYILGEDSENSDHALWLYNDNTDNWTDLSANVPKLGGLTGDFDSQGGYDLLIKVKNDDPDFVVIGGTNLFASSDGFSSTNNTEWIGGYTSDNNSYALYPNHHPDQHSFVFLDGDRAYSGNDGGVQLTSDVTASSVSWVPLNNGYLTSQIYAVSAGPEDQLMVGLQDNGTWFANNSTLSNGDWSDPFGGDGAYSAISDDGTHRYVSSQNANIYRLDYTNSNSLVYVSFDYMTPASVNYSTSLFITPFYLDESDDDVFYLGGDEDLWVNTQASSGNENSGWKAIVLTGSSGVVSEMGVGSDAVVYVGTSSGNIVKVSNASNASPTVEDVTGINFPVAYVSGIGVNPENSDEVLISFSSYNVPSLFYTDDAGKTWTDVSGNLEENADGSGNGPSVRVARIHGDGHKYYAGTSTGLYSADVLDGSNTSWVREGEELIGAAVVEHMVTRTDGLVVAATHGNGVFSADVPFTSSVPTDITLTNNVIAESESVGTYIGTLETVDEDNNVDTYTLVDGDGADDNEDFDISGSDLVSGVIFDFEVKSVYTIRIQTEDKDGNSFSKAFEINISDVTAIDDWEKAGIVVYPNPTKGKVTFEMINDYIGNVSVKVYDLNGKEVLSQHNYNKLDKRTRSLLDISHLEAGSYFVEFNFGGQEITSRLIKE